MPEQKNQEFTQRRKDAKKTVGVQGNSPMEVAAEVTKLGLRLREPSLLTSAATSDGFVFKSINHGFLGWRGSKRQPIRVISVIRGKSFCSSV